MDIIISGIWGLLGLISIIIGLCSRRFKTAFIGGSIVGSVVLIVGDIAAVIFIALYDDLNKIQLSGYFTGYLTETIGTIIVMGLCGLFGHSIRWGFGALFRRFRRSSMPQASES